MSELGHLVTQAANLVHSAIYPGDEVRPPRGDVPDEVAVEMEQAVRLLTEAETHLAPGIGQPNTVAGLAKLREAQTYLGPIDNVFLPTEVSQAREDARKLIDRAIRNAEGR